MKSRHRRWNPSTPRRKFRSLKEVLGKIGKEGRRRCDKRATPCALKEPTQFARSRVNEWLRLDWACRVTYSISVASIPAFRLCPCQDFSTKSPSKSFIHLPLLSTLYHQSYHHFVPFILQLYKPCGSDFSAPSFDAFTVDLGAPQNIHPPFYPLAYCWSTSRISNMIVTMQARNLRDLL